MKAFFLTGLLVISVSISFASPFSEDTLRLSQKEAEGLFLNNNLDLLAQKLSIRQAEAQIIQAKLWPNPEFSIDELNLWTTKNQLSSGETIPPLIGNFGKNREFTAELTQVIETAGKRKKRIALESVSRDIASEYFSEVIRNLKTELRKNLFELAYHQSFLSVLKGQDDTLGSLLLSFENQYAQGNLNKPELFRLKALKLELSQQILEARKEVHAAQKSLSILLNLPVSQYLVVQDISSPNPGTLKALSLDNLMATAGSARPDAKISFLQQTWAQKNYDLEYAQRKPDLTFGMNYDRGGNFLLNFFGFGFKMDLPVFNRNQGAILGSKIGISKSKVESEQKIKGIEAEVAQAFRDLQKSVDAYQNLDPAYGEDLDQVFLTYTLYYTKRQIGMVEYLDFFEAYISNKRTILLTLKQLQDSREELSFATGAEIE
ncbi:TolC family protein [Dyadobacter frigoris]|uniref:TolC family protein n=1 Tax=Dyadobacter frigoris TaxID=2576211 RepID=A0A4U6D904_9BACT|nr:TolC family protein [Dyadobacter frigoris]TKT92608.1 TolC family protein [Dyadobacter frigoris]GLU51499.1 cation transporter [Dyadobacter frigoris]